ncbi:MAG: DUF4198 domain-containing protein [Lacunisphaera sp.]
MKSPLLAFTVFGIAVVLSAHECWLQPASFAPVAGPAIGLTIQVGMNFDGEVRPFTPERVAALRHYSAAGAEDWTARLNGKLQFPAKFEDPGTHVIIYNSKPGLITLEPDKFNAYLREEGLDFVIAERERTGESAKPGRERYLRCNKTIVRADGKADGTYAVVTGQRLEIIPVDDPAAWSAGEPSRFKLLFAGQPLADAKVRAWHRGGGRLTTLDAITAANGEVSFALAASGEWMLSAVHMARLTGDAAADWESHWGNLTFAVSAGR